MNAYTTQPECEIQKRKQCMRKEVGVEKTDTLTQLGTIEGKGTIWQLPSPLNIKRKLTAL
jgi:hypothetical protein